ncbi:MAG TPA: recombinase family protein [Stellaceae bacterium]
MAAVGRRQLPIVLRNLDVYKPTWKAPAYHTVIQIPHNPLYAGAYAYGRRTQRTKIVDGRTRKVSGLDKPRDEWNVLLRDSHPGHIDWQEYEDNQKLLLENAHMKKNCPQVRPRLAHRIDAVRPLRADDARLLCMGKGNAHRYQCRGDDGHVGARLCIGIGGVRIDRAVALQILEGRLRSCRQSGDPRFQSGGALAEGRHRGGRAGTRGGAI